MAVGRIQFEQGFALGEQIPEPTAVLPLLKPHLGRLTIMAFGSMTNVTPALWKGNDYNYYMEVSDAGDGVLHREKRHDISEQHSGLVPAEPEVLDGIDPNHIDLNRVGGLPLIGGHPKMSGLHMYEFFMPIPNDMALVMQMVRQGGPR